ncbi:MAG TPA: pre-peptidase C-terminal domain-containing protein, partial [Myxococcota bacterium]|nr:pre-peptidase C-terminal domain-containing protein [Myxococcota bacterium]
ATNRPGLYPATGNSCPQDDDCFGAVLQNGQAGTFTMTYDYTNDGDVDLTLYDIPGGTLLDVSAGTTDVDEVTWYNGTGAPVPVAACANLYSDNGGAPGAAYRMALSITTPVACAADALEPNDDSGTARARTPGHTAALSACMADRWDWYKVDARAGQTVTFTALHSYAEGDIDVYAVPAAGPNDTAQLSGAALDADTATTDNATVEFVAPADGTYWFAVYLYSDRGNALQGGANYELDIAVQ